MFYQDFAAQECFNNDLNTTEKKLLQVCRRLIDPIPACILPHLSVTETCLLTVMNEMQ